MTDPAGMASDESALIAANAAFYAAFARRDADALDALWAEDVTVACIHPGWSPRIGREAVMESWRAIVANPGSPRIVPEEPVAVVLGAVGLVICYERLGNDTLVATNTFLRQNGAWRMVHHQASPLAEPRPRPVAAQPPQRRPGQVLH
ncbi:nuclear transport factor 2 family protein [Zavarzinia sp. CC-PAN008]|uniref:nuclear transport factor 2 family protein n=1 Tax=Zavarzinia sp. CC-PAN008 TaxID=3243332 RepID=UPI003F747BAF